MISSLDEAWRWYTNVKEQTLAMQALGRKHWNSLPWDGNLGRDDRLRQIEAPQIVISTKAILADLDDLCVLLLFSVFEAKVRERALVEVAAELPVLRHAALRQAMR